VTRVFTIWPADKQGQPASGSAWRQERDWLVLDITEGLTEWRIVEGPVTKAVALQRELELRAAHHKPRKGAA
jgi:hypothetical protein